MNFVNYYRTSETSSNLCDFNSINSIKIGVGIGQYKGLQPPLQTCDEDVDMCVLSESEI